MTDKEIKKALESEIHLAKYVDSSYCDGVNVPLLEATIDLINHYEAEIEMLQKLLESRHRAIEFLEGRIISLPDEIRAETVEEFAEKVHTEIYEALESNYKARQEHINKWKDPNAYIGGDFVSMCDGKIAALQGIDYFINSLEKEMTEQRKEDENGKELS